MGEEDGGGDVDDDDDDDEGVLGSSLAGEADGDASSVGTSMFEISSPSSASTAIILPTGMFFEPSGCYQAQSMNTCQKRPQYYTNDNFAHDTIILGLDIHGCLVRFLTIFSET